MIRLWQSAAVDQATLESAARLLADGVADVVGVSRTDALRACGNGVVPLQAAVALRLLLRRFEED